MGKIVVDHRQYNIVQKIQTNLEEWNVGDLAQGNSMDRKYTGFTKRRKQNENY